MVARPVTFEMVANDAAVTFGATLFEMAFGPSELPTIVDRAVAFIGDVIEVDVIAAVTTIIDAVCCPDEFDDDGCRPTISFASAKLDC